MSNCTDIDEVEWTEPGRLASLACLAFINVLVIVGNCLVIAAVFSSHKLRSVTNFFIVSLAVADLLVGIAVLPFSATWEVFKVWFSQKFSHFLLQMPVDLAIFVDNVCWINFVCSLSHTQRESERRIMMFGYF